MKSVRRVLCWSCCCVFSLALLVRGVYLAEIANAPVAQRLLGDAETYDRWAADIVTGEWLGEGVFYQAPGYAYFLAAVYTVFGHSLLAARLVQNVLGSVSCVLLVLAGRRFFGPREGMLAGVLLALYPPAIFFDGLIQKTALDTFLLCAILSLLGRCLDEPSPLAWGACGTCFGLLALTRETSLVLLAVALVWVFLHFRTVSRRKRIHWGCALMLGAALVLAPVALRNVIVGGEFHLTTFQLGPNFYIGNNRDADGTYAPLRWGRGNARFERTDAVELAQEALGRPLGPAEVSGYWTRRAVEYIRSDPGAWLQLMVRKWLLVWNSAELGDTEDLYTYGDSSLLLRSVYRVYHFGVLVPLAVLGVCLVGPRIKRHGLLVAIVLAYAAAVTAFFVLGRYRFPLVPPLVLLGAGGCCAAWDLLQAGRYPRLLACGVASVLAAVPANLSLVSESRTRATTLFNIATELGGNPASAEPALAHYREALRLHPSFTAAWFNLGNTLARRGELQPAIEAYRRALELRPHYSEAHNNLGTALRRRGELAQAAESFQSALRVSPEYTEAHVNLGLVLAEQGLFQQALDSYGRALRLQPDNADAHYNLGNALAGLGRLDAAALEYSEALRIAPHNARAHNNLGFALAALGRIDEAVESYSHALRLAPDYAEAHTNLAAALGLKRRTREAIEHYFEAVRLAPGMPVPLNNLAWILATHEDPSLRDSEQAVRLAERACELTHYSNPVFLGTLGAAHAAAGRFDEAIRWSHRALAIARSRGQTALAQEIVERIRRFSAPHAGAS